MGDLIACLCDRLCGKSWSSIECFALCYCFYKIKNGCVNIKTKIAGCFKNCFHSVTDCCKSKPIEDIESPAVPQTMNLQIRPNQTSSEVFMDEGADNWPEIQSARLSLPKAYTTPLPPPVVMGETTDNWPEEG